MVFNDGSDTYDEVRSLILKARTLRASCSAAISMRPATVRMGIRHRGNGMIVAA